jgi:hypothetical protein
LSSETCTATVHATLFRVFGTIHVMEEVVPHARTVGAEFDARGELQRLPVSRRLDANVQCWGEWPNLKRSLTL